jgi:hypothetical protein
MTKTGRAAIARPKDKSTALETPVMRATRRILANLDKQRAEIAQLRSAVLAALA